MIYLTLDSNLYYIPCTKLHNHLPWGILFLLYQRMEWEKDAYSYLLINLFNGIALFASKVALSGYQFAKGNMVASI